MTGSSAREYTYEEFNSFVRRFHQEALLKAVAQRSLRVPLRLSSDDRSTLLFQQTPPWALAAVAKASILHGNAYRSAQPREQHIVTACQMHENLVPEELEHSELNSPFAIMARTLYEQFPYQEHGLAELARPVAFFDDYAGDRHLEVNPKEAMTHLVGAPTVTATGIVVMLAASAEHNSGFFDPAWLDQPQFAELLTVLPRDEILAVIHAVFAQTMAEFRQENAVAEQRTPLPHLDRYAFNPLTSRPFVRLSDGRLIAPVRHLIPRRLTPLELYYVGLARWGTSFTRELGYLHEDYVGRQFATVPDAQVYPEIMYRERKQQVASTDWFVVFDDLVLLIETKATRSPLAARAADITVQDAYGKTLGEAFSQLGRTLDKIRAKAPEFADIPTDRPFIGLVATLDPWYFANSLGRTFLPTPALPTLVAPLRDIEHLISIGQRRSVSAILQEILAAGDERQTWELGTALQNYSVPGDRNPLLEEAFNRLPIRNGGAEAAGRA
ncbi:hypothetical protein [Paractinoplanes ferrugineus]|uniref:hypothetical protein n=1 Tax=Paractinoplanes ferrugineus TaxID=113564 RepID=UPI0019459CF0|nr:hypothetical protein [Actinoplanes ferrugineus]